MGDGNERTGDEASSRRERSETADGRRNSGHGKGSGSCREDGLQGRGGHNRDRIHLALERVLMIRVARQPPADVRFALLRGREKTFSEVAFMPLADSWTAAKSNYSITSSARASSMGGISRSSTLAVLRLITSSNFVDCWMGRSAGFSPLSIRPV
jgi:hypothetical protein